MNVYQHLTTSILTSAIQDVLMIRSVDADNITGYMVHPNQTLGLKAIDRLSIGSFEYWSLKHLYEYFKNLAFRFFGWGEDVQLRPLAPR